MTGPDQITLPSGRRLSATVSGEGSPTVVFLAGFMAGASEWSAVQRQVARRTRTVSYDRAGHGDSSDPKAAPTTATALADLLDLLDVLEVRAPAVFVAHSWGGTLLRLLAREHPDRVAAACLVDATRSALLSARQTRAQGTSLRVLARLAPLGVHRTLLRRALADRLDGLEDGERAYFLADSTSLRTLRAGVRENAGMTGGDLELLAALEQQGLPDVPVTFVVGERADVGSRKVRAGMLAGHEQEAQAHPAGRFVVAADSGHMVPQQQPDLVAREVLDLVGSRTRG